MASDQRRHRSISELLTSITSLLERALLAWSSTNWSAHSLFSEAFIVSAKVNICTSRHYCKESSSTWLKLILHLCSFENNYQTSKFDIRSLYGDICYILELNVQIKFANKASVKNYLVLTTVKFVLIQTILYSIINLLWLIWSVNLI